VSHVAGFFGDVHSAVAVDLLERRGRGARAGGVGGGKGERVGHAVVPSLHGVLDALVEKIGDELEDARAVGGVEVSADCVDAQREREAGAGPPPLPEIDDEPEALLGVGDLPFVDDEPRGGGASSDGGDDLLEREADETGEVGVWDQSEGMFEDEKGRGLVPRDGDVTFGLEEFVERGDGAFCVDDKAWPVAFAEAAAAAGDGVSACDVRSAPAGDGESGDLIGGRRESVLVEVVDVDGLGDEEQAFGVESWWRDGVALGVDFAGERPPHEDVVGVWRVGECE